MATTAPPLDPAELFGPAPAGAKGAIMKLAMAAMPYGFRLARRFKPFMSLGGAVVPTRYDDVREVFETDTSFGVPYKPELDVIMGGQPFFLGMGDTEQYRADTGAMRKVVRIDDVKARIAPAVEAQAEQIVRDSGGRVEVVDQLTRRVTFDRLGEYFGVTDPPGGDLRIWGTQLFRFQFAESGNPELRKIVNDIAPRLRDHIQSLIEARRAAGTGPDDVLGRCIQMQAKGELGFTDDQIRTALMGFVVGGPPQPPMVVPQALEQLLRRPDQLANAQAAARADDDEALSRYFFEALRFDPIAPRMERIALKDSVIAAGTPREQHVKAGTKVWATMGSAMRDGRRLPDAERFEPNRLPYEYMHFGHGLHTCFGIHINKGTLHLMVKPLLKRNLRRARGKAGHLQKQGPFAVSLWVEYD
jgi:cytochrome P450